VFLGDGAASEFCCLRRLTYSEKGIKSFVIDVQAKRDSVQTDSDRRIPRFRGRLRSVPQRRQGAKIAQSKISAEYSDNIRNTEYRGEGQSRDGLQSSSAKPDETPLFSSGHFPLSLSAKEALVRNGMPTSNAEDRTKAHDTVPAPCDEASTRVPFLGGWAETFPDVVERGTGVGSPGAAHCRIPFLFGTQRRPAALAILAPPESTSLYARIPFLSGSIRPPRSDETGKGTERQDNTTLAPLSHANDSHAVSGVSESLGNISESRRVLSDLDAIKLPSEAVLSRSGSPALEMMRHAGAQAEVDHVVARARRAAAAALEELRFASQRSVFASQGYVKQQDQESSSWTFEIDAASCQDMIAVNMNRTVVHNYCFHSTKKFVLLTFRVALLISRFSFVGFRLFCP
jgi:hypothetical protein